VLLVAGAVVVAALAGGGLGLVSDRTDEPDSVQIVPSSRPRIPETGGTTSSAPDDGDPAELFARVRSGIVRIRASSCDGSGAGTGFLIEGDRVATAAHVVSGAVAISVETDSRTYTASIESIDEAADLASLRLSEPDPGHVFRFTSGDPAPGTRVAVIGYPLDGPLSISEGTVSGIDRVVDTDTGPLGELLQTDAAVNPGNSGGPIVTSSGEAAGVISGEFSEYEGLGFAVQSSTAEPWFATSTNSSTVQQATCPRPLGPEVTGDVALPVTADWTEGVAAAFSEYFGGINTGDYQAAWLRLSPDRRERTTLDEFSTAVRTSYDFGFVVNDASYADHRASVWLEFISIQDPSLGPQPGESCTRWSLDYILVEQPDGTFLIDDASGHADSSGHEPCQ
jgi:serine protease Do